MSWLERSISGNIIGRRLNNILWFDSHDNSLCHIPMTKAETVEPGFHEQRKRNISTSASTWVTWKRARRKRAWSPALLLLSFFLRRPYRFLSISGVPLCFICTDETADLRLRLRPCLRLRRVRFHGDATPLALALMLMLRLRRTWKRGFRLPTAEVLTSCCHVVLWKQEHYANSLIYVRLLFTCAHCTFCWCDPTKGFTAKNVQASNMHGGEVRNTSCLVALERLAQFTATIRSPIPSLPSIAAAPWGLIVFT